MTVFSDLELSACIQTEHKSQDLQISRIDVQPKTLPEGQTTGTIRLVFSFPATDISGRWYPICQFDRSVKADWYTPVESMTASSAPVVCFYRADSRNRHTIALSEVRKKVFLKCGIHEEDGSMRCVIDLPITQGFSEKEFQFSVWESVEEKSTGRYLMRYAAGGRKLCTLFRPQFRTQRKKQCIPSGILCIRTSQQKTWKKKADVRRS